jgi:UrcA family protein
LKAAHEKDVKMTTLKKFTAVALAASAMSLTMPAAAEWRSVEVQVNDLDLSSPAGEKSLRQRIERAIRQVCRSDETKAASERRDVKKCETAARLTAATQANVRIAAYRAQNPRMARAEIAAE